MKGKEGKLELETNFALSGKLEADASHYSETCAGAISTRHHLRCVLLNFLLCIEPGGKQESKDKSRA